jgi:hypothetical protein
MKMWCERWASARSEMGRERGAPAKVGYMKSGGNDISGVEEDDLGRMEGSWVDEREERSHD